jgi:DNA-binding beta-propeller fold protein YncE
MQLLVSSAKAAHGAGYGTVLAFDFVGSALGTFCDDSRIADPRGLCVDQSGNLLYVNNGNDRVLAIDQRGRVRRDTDPIDALDPGGGVIGPDGRYYVGSRRLRTIMAMPARLDGPAIPHLPLEVVPFPRGFAFAPDDGRLFLASGVSPSGHGEDTIKVFDPDGHLLAPRLVEDSQLSPLDLAVAPNGNIVVSSEWPFGVRDAISSVREYDSSSGRLVRIFRTDGSILFRNPRGLRFSQDGDLYCVARDEVASFDFESGDFTGAIVNCSDLFGQALEFFG